MGALNRTRDTVLRHKYPTEEIYLSVVNMLHNAHRMFTTTFPNLHICIYIYIYISMFTFRGLPKPG